MSADPEITTAFADLIHHQIDGLVITNDPFLASRSAQVAGLTVRHAVPTISPYRTFVTAGGLISYATNLPDLYRLTGVLTGRVLNGEKPADLPFLQPTKFELVINLKAAKALGITVPPSLLTAADEVIE